MALTRVNRIWQDTDATSSRPRHGRILCSKIRHKREDQSTGNNNITVKYKYIYISRGNDLFLLPSVSPLFRTMLLIHISVPLF